MVLRFTQAIGSSAGLSVGSGVIGDIYNLEERYVVQRTVCVSSLHAIVGIQGELRWVSSSGLVPSFAMPFLMIP